jgi:hypothetical protein
MSQKQFKVLPKDLQDLIIHGDYVAMKFGAMPTLLKNQRKFKKTDSYKGRNLF